MRFTLRVLAAVTALLSPQLALAYSATAQVTFHWAQTGSHKGWSSQGTNSLPQMSDATYFSALGGNNSVSYYNSDFAAASDYAPGTADDCLTPLPDYELVTLRKYGCRHMDVSGYYDPIFIANAPSDAGPGAAASGTLTVTDTTLTGTLTVIPTTDEPTGGTTTSAGNGASAYNLRTADGSPFGNAWYGVSTSLTLAVNLTGSFSAASWQITGGTVRFNDPGFQCQQGGLGGFQNNILCTTSGAVGGNGPGGSTLSWGVDLDGGGPGTAMGEIEVRNVTGTAVLDTLSGVRASINLDAGGNIHTATGEYRSGLGTASGSGCTTHLRWDGQRLSCGTLIASDLAITGIAVEDQVPDTVPDAFAFPDLTGVSVDAPIVSDTLAFTGFNVATPITVTGGEYSIGCEAGGFTDFAGVLSPGETVCVRHTSPSTFFTSTDTTLSVGGVSDTFTSTTGNLDTYPNPISFPSQDNRATSQFVISNLIVVTGITGPTPVSVTNGFWAPNCFAFTAEPGSVTDGTPICVAHVTPNANNAQKTTVLNVGGREATFTTTTFPLPGADVTTYNITGSMATAVAHCFQISVLINGTDCSYAGTRSPGFPWAGPSLGGGFYPKGSAGDDLAYGPIAGDGKLSPSLSGTVTIDNQGTSDGADDTIQAHWEFGSAAFNATTGNGDRAVERWDTWTHEMPATEVSSATPLANGGYRYVIGSRGAPTPAPLCAQASPADCFPSESGSALSTTGFWNSNVVDTVPVAARAGIERSPGFGDFGAGQPLTPNVGAQTTATLGNYECVDQPGDTDCSASEILIGAGTSPGSSAGPPGFDNVVIVLETNGSGAITSAEAYWTREYRLAVGPAIGTDESGNYLTDNSWVGGRFTFSGASGGTQVPRANNDIVTIELGSGPHVINVLANDTGLVGSVMVFLCSDPRYGTAVVNPDNTITYTPTGNFEIQDYFQYRVIDTNGAVSFAIIRVNLESPVIADADSDGIADGVDNCVQTANADQRDSNGDGIGSMCDGDLNDDGMVNFLDLALFRQRFGTADSHADFDGSGMVNFADLAIFRGGFGRPPGPSAVAAQ